MTSRNRALAEVSAMYVFILLVGAATYLSSSGTEPGRFLLADLAMTGVTFGFSLWRRNSSVYDAYWSVVPFAFVALFFVTAEGRSWSALQWATAAGVSFWSWRLTLNWARGWPGWAHEDWRYSDFREQLGSRFFWMNLFGIHLFPTAIVFAACMPLFWVYRPESANGLLHAGGVALCFLGGLLELVADNQLARFRQRPDPRPTDLLDSGIWGVVRYPNYLGEMTFWFGVAVCGEAAGAPLWASGGSLAMVALFVFASIPLKDKRMASRRPGFVAYKARVPSLIPRPSGRRA